VGIEERGEGKGLESSGDFELIGMGGWSGLG
jgi:hypothetical protein